MTEIREEKAPSALVQEGWGHLFLHRPLAAWACWQRAVRIDPGQTAALKALEGLSSATELPESARVEYRFRTPADEARRLRWDDGFGGRDLSDLTAAAEAFARLAEDDPTDADAAENLALCLAWLGQNAHAIEALDQVVRLTAGSDFDRAVAAWKLAEVLRQGAGAEALAEDFSHAIDLTGSGEPDRLYEALASRAVLRRLPSPVDPAVDPSRRDVTVDEWLSRPMPGPHEGEVRLDELPRVLAIVFASDLVFKLSLPSFEGLIPVLASLSDLGLDPTPTRNPLPLAILDAAVWTIRLPEWVDDQSRRRLYRENVEDYYENRWINRPFVGLNGETPLKAGRVASGGDTALRAKLEAMIAVREELAARPASIELYQGYPFDRLRKRLDLPLKYPEAVDAIDEGCMSGPDLDAISPEALDDYALADAFRSAAALGDDDRTARFAIPLVEREPALIARIDLETIFAPLVRLALAKDDSSEALAWIDRAAEIDRDFHEGRRARVFATWKAELLARTDEPDEAVRVYQSLIDDSESPAWVAIDAAATLLDNGHPEHARGLAELAIEQAQRLGDERAGREAEGLLHGLDA